MLRQNGVPKPLNSGSRVEANQLQWKEVCGVRWAGWGEDSAYNRSRSAMTSFLNVRCNKLGKKAPAHLTLHWKPSLKTLTLMCDVLIVRER